MAASATSTSGCWPNCEPGTHRPERLHLSVMHRAHDYGHLIERWRGVARAAGLRLRQYARAGRFPLYYLRTPALQPEGGLYLSAGIHGDEPAATEALLQWAAGHGKSLRELPALFFPCLNPWGLLNNVRSNAGGLDLNRCYHLDTMPEIAAQRALIAPYQFESAITLHEDYDAQGLYLYEIQRTEPYWGEKLLRAARGVIAIEGRERVDGRTPVGGLIRRKIDYRRFRAIGYPEAIWLHLEHSRRTFTVETPSEFALEVRVAAHGAVLREAERLFHNARGSA